MNNNEEESDRMRRRWGELRAAMGEARAMLLEAIRRSRSLADVARLLGTSAAEVRHFAKEVGVSAGMSGKGRLDAEGVRSIRSRLGKASIRQVAKELGVSGKTLAGWCKRNYIDTDSRQLKATRDEKLMKEAARMRAGGLKISEIIKELGIGPWKFFKLKKTCPELWRAAEAERKTLPRYRSVRRMPREEWRELNEKYDRYGRDL